MHSKTQKPAEKSQTGLFIGLTLVAAFLYYNSSHNSSNPGLTGLTERLFPTTEYRQSAFTSAPFSSSNPPARNNSAQIYVAADVTEPHDMYAIAYCIMRGDLKSIIAWDAIRAGNTPAAAARIAGIAGSTLHSQLKAIITAFAEARAAAQGVTA